MPDGEQHRGLMQRATSGEYNLSPIGEQRNGLLGRATRGEYNLPMHQTSAQQIHPSAYGVYALAPAPIDPQFIMQRADEVNTVHRMLVDTRTNAVVITGSSGAGKSILAALLYNRILQATQASVAAGPQHLIWLETGTYTTVPGMIAAILNGLQVQEPGFALMKAEQQISALLRALRRPQESALIVLDQFETMLYDAQNVSSRGALSLFLEMLQSDLGDSRILFTSYETPFDENMAESRVRSYLVSRISMPEGLALLQRYGLDSSPEQLSLIWQRCAGHVFALVLFCAVVHLSGISISYLLDSSEYQPMWAGEVTQNLLTAIYHFLSPIQYVLMRTLSLFHEPVPLRGIATAITGNGATTQVSIAEIEKELETLTSLALVRVTVDVFNIASYDLHPLIREYILEHFLEGGEQRYPEGLAMLEAEMPFVPAESQKGPEAAQAMQAAGHMQVAAYYYNLAQEYPSPEQRAGLQDVMPIISTIHHLCLGWHWQDACDLLFAEGLHQKMVEWGMWNMLIGLYTALLPPSAHLAPQDEATIFGHLGMLYGRMDEREQSHTYFEQALTLQRQVSDFRGEITTLANQGELFRAWGEIEQARMLFEQALRLNEKQQDVVLQYTILHNLGLLYHDEKNYELAFKCYKEAIKMAYGPRARLDKAMIITSMGLLLYEQRVYKEGLSLLLGALQLRQALNDSSTMTLELFLKALEQKMGQEAYAMLKREAIEVQQQVFSRFVMADMRQ
ncbi:ATP-binding protein [Ktedonosporobacter rubrisoli]|uniref:ATP-binding protein n=1 Tax=Ktedonosporobacter rubrisoli TaxID=2509675 RepID=A0A4P6JWJ4_KTERU|nr:tetratricopeptide repeat protein [Ktedonosporobacter rubrisoli]QBD79944.1 ATP-binding protein [Ktedonosporobacter rubrisoli]